MDSRQQSGWTLEVNGSMADERAHLVRFCGRLTGDPDAAEDLAQETLVRAYRQVDHLPEPGRRLPWLLGIARHACLDWIRRRQRERAREIGYRTLGTSGRDGDERTPDVGSDLAERVADDFDVAVELDRAELAELLDRALALLPTESREVLVARYVEESSLADVARRLGVSEGAVAMRLQRGKLRLRRLLGTRLRHEAETFGLVSERGDQWQETRIWCPSCGRRHLVGRFDERVYQLRCPDCDAPPGVYLANAEFGDLHGLLRGVKRFQPALSRLMPWTYRSVQPTLDEGRGTCVRCGAPTTVVLRMPEDAPPSIRNLPGVTARCGQCGWLSANGLGIVVLVLPEVRQFWKDHPRIRTLPRREVESQGVAAVVTRLESVTDAASVEVVTSRVTLRVLGIHRSAR